MRSKKSQFFIMSVVLLSLAIFILMRYSLSIDEASAVMFEHSSKIDLKNIENAIKDPGNCNGDNLCSHFEAIYSGKFKFSCDKIGSSAPYNYTISIISRDLEFTGNLTQTITCPVTAVCGNGIVEGGEVCDWTAPLCTADPNTNYHQDCVGDCGGGNPDARCKDDCSDILIISDIECCGVLGC